MMILLLPCSIHRYVANRAAASRVLLQRMADPAVAQYLRACQVSLDAKLGLENDLLKPVQRILKYNLLLGEQIKGSDEGDEGYDALVKAQQIMKEICEHINSAKRKRELDGIMYGEVQLKRTEPLYERIVGYDGDISEFGDLLNEKDGFTVNKTSQRRLFLFQKALVSTKPRPDGKLGFKRFFPLSNYSVRIDDDHTFAMVDLERREPDVVFSHPAISAKTWRDQMEV